VKFGVLVSGAVGFKIATVVVFCFPLIFIMSNLLCDQFGYRSGSVEFSSLRRDPRVPILPVDQLPLGSRPGEGDAIRLDLD